MASKQGVRAVILDKDGVFVDFHKLWLRIIAYRAQLIAENSTDTWDKFDKVRTACIRAMGVDEDDEYIDPYSPASLPADLVKLALYTSLFLTVNEYDTKFTWKQAKEIVEKSLEETLVQLDPIELSESIGAAVNKIKEIAKHNLKIAVWTSDTEKNTKRALEKFDLKSEIDSISAAQIKTKESFLALCKALNVSPEETICVSDSPRDLEAASRAGAYSIGVLSGVVSAQNIDLLKEFADEIIDSLDEFDLSMVKSAITKSKKKVRA